VDNNCHNGRSAHLSASTDADGTGLTSVIQSRDTWGTHPCSATPAANNGGSAYLDLMSPSWIPNRRDGQRRPPVRPCAYYAQAGPSDVDRGDDDTPNEHAHSRRHSRSPEKRRALNIQANRTEKHKRNVKDTWQQQQAEELVTFAWTYVTFYIFMHVCKYERMQMSMNDV